MTTISMKYRKNAEEERDEVYAALVRSGIRPHDSRVDGEMLVFNYRLYASIPEVAEIDKRLRSNGVLAKDLSRRLD